MFDFDVDAIARAARERNSFRLRTRTLSGSIVFDMGGEAYRLVLNDGALESFAREVSGGDADLIIAAPVEFWEKLFMQVPPDGYQAVLFSSHHAKVSLTGTRVGEGMIAFYPAISEFVDVMRRARSGARNQPPVDEGSRKFDAAVGRYARITIDGVPQRIYFEEAGTGPVAMILQHTANADGRQWRHLLEDPDMQRMFRMISYDLPYHGKSLPPTSVEWWEQDYRLTRQTLIDTVLGICDALELDRPVYMGCSIGGMLAPDLALAHPERFRAVVGINAGLGLEPAQGNFYGELGRQNGNLGTGGLWAGAVNYGLTSPTAPEAYRREVSWLYSQGAPGIMSGDTYYYAIDHDLTAEQASRIDTSKVKVYLLTCEYDPLNRPEGTPLLANAIKGSHFEILPGMGHFGPAENPELFLSQTLPLFEEIARLP